MPTPYHKPPNRTNLLYEGIKASTPVLRDRHLRRHRVVFEVFKKMPKWDQKALAMRYLVVEYEACDFEFFRVVGKDQNHFVCEFTSFAL